MNYIPKESKLQYTAEWILIVESSGVSQKATQLVRPPHSGTPHSKKVEGLWGSGLCILESTQLVIQFNQLGSHIFCSFCAAHSPTLHNFITIIRVCCYIAVIKLLHVMSILLF